MRVIIILSIFISLLQANMTARAIIDSTQRTTISSELSGNMIYFSKQEGEYFKKGSLLAKIDCSLYEAQKRKINIQKKIAFIKMQKNEELDKLNSIGRFEVLISKEEYNKQVAELNIVALNVKRCRIYAPFNGRIVERKVNLYENVKAQQEIVDIIGTNNIEVKVIVPALWLRWLKKGDKFSLNVDETQTKVKAIVKEIGAVVDSRSQTISLRAELIKPTSNIITGMSATAYFNSKSNLKNEKIK